MMSFVPSKEKTCPGCYGRGVQRNKKTGLNVLCARYVLGVGRYVSFETSCIGER